MLRGKGIKLSTRNFKVSNHHKSHIKIMKMSKIAILMFLAVFKYTLSINPNATSSPLSCSCEKLTSNIEKIFDRSLLDINYLGMLPLFAASSCQQIHDLKPKAPSGTYWIQGKSGPSQVYCQMEGNNCGDGVWMRVANVNMKETGTSCPNGLVKAPTSDLLCRRSTETCSSSMFSTFIPFHKVCGKMIAYQFHSPDAFRPFHDHPTRTIDDLYVDGVSITHSHSPRHHIWTFAAGLQESTSHSTSYSCPCSFTKSNVPYVGTIPPFIGNDFSCETASRTTFSNRYYDQDPLWDGNGCGIFSTCCKGEGKTWFVKSFSRSISSEIEVRVCADQHRPNEDIWIEQLYLFVQ